MTIVVFLWLSILIAFAYARSLSNQFISDDWELVSAFGSTTFDPVRTFSRPTFMRELVYSGVVTIIGGVQPWALRLSNILFHLGVCILAYLLITRLASRMVAIIAVSFFAVHPILVESVAWISGGVYAQYAFFFLLALVLYDRSGRNKPLLWASWGTFFLSLATSDKAIVLSPLFILYEWSFGNIRANWKKLVPFFLLSALWGMYIVFISGYISKAEVIMRSRYYPSSFDNPLVRVAVSIAKYIELIIWPKTLSYYQSELLYPPIINGMLITLALVLFVVIIVGLVRKRQFVFWLCVFVVPLLPTIAPFRLSSVVAESYAYLPALGGIALLSLVFHHVIARRYRYIGIVLVLCVLAALTSRTMSRISDWKDDETFWTATMRSAPSNPSSYRSLGNYYVQQRKYTMAKEVFEKGIALGPNNSIAYDDLGNAYVHLGDVPRAIDSYQQAILRNSGDYEAYFQLGASYIKLNRYEEAIDALISIQSVDDQNDQLWANLALAYLGARKLGEAKSAVEHALQLDPTNKTAQFVRDKLNKQER